MHWHTHTPTRSNVTISGMPSSGLFPHTLATHANVEGPPRTNTKRANDALTIINIHAQCRMSNGNQLINLFKKKIIRRLARKSLPMTCEATINNTAPMTLSPCQGGAWPDPPIHPIQNLNTQNKIRHVPGFHEVASFPLPSFKTTLILLQSSCNAPVFTQACFGARVERTKHAQDIATDGEATMNNKQEVVVPVVVVVVVVLLLLLLPFPCLLLLLLPIIIHVLATTLRFQSPPSPGEHASS